MYLICKGKDTVVLELLYNILYYLLKNTILFNQKIIKKIISLFHITIIDHIQNIICDSQTKYATLIYFLLFFNSFNS